MWIMLIKHIPTQPSPPKMGIFWSVPWPNEEWAKDQIRRAKADGYGRRRDDEEDVQTEYEAYDENRSFGPLGGHGLEPNWKGARKVTYKGSEVRVFPHEFSVIKQDRMRLYVLGTEGEGPSHDLVAEGVASDVLIKGVLDSDTKFIYDAALLDGCTPEEALAVALGQDITEPDSEFPPLGWYRPRDWVVEQFCEEWEKEDADTDSSGKEAGAAVRA